MYLTFAEYQTIGGTLSEQDFNKNIFRVCKIIDSETHSRVANMGTVPDEVKYLCRDLVEYINTSISTNGIVSSRSQSAGNVSESESYAVSSVSEMENTVDDMIFQYLSTVKDDNGIPLLFRGYTK